MKLKTLENLKVKTGFESGKGLPILINGHEIVYADELKQEAIKHIKELSKAYRFNEIVKWEIFKRELDVKLIEKRDPALFMIQWIIGFFNITDEMLDKKTIRE